MGFRSSDLSRIGACLSTYWSQKRTMAEGSEPRAIAEMRRRLEPHLIGFELAGAGGGGFAVLITREANQRERIQAELAKCSDVEGATLHTAEIDRDGMTVRIAAS